MLKDRIRETGKFLRHCFLPRRCAVCGRLVTYNQDFCEECEPIFAITPRNFYFDSKNMHSFSSSFSAKIHYDGVVHTFHYSGCAKNLVRNYKFYQRRELAPILVKELLETFRKYYSDVEIDCVCPVPADAKSRFLRGFDQVYLLAEPLSRRVELPFEPLLRQSGKKKVQHHISVASRIENVRGIYSPRPNLQIKGKRILLVDDVITTGATVNECAKVLKRAGADKVYCISVAGAKF